MTRIHNIGHIHNANFAQTQFSTSHPQKQHFLKSRKFTFLWKYLVCGLKFEISEYHLNSTYVTYSPYQYELKRIKTHEMRAKNFWVILFSVHCIVIKIFSTSCFFYFFSVHFCVSFVKSLKLWFLGFLRVNFDPFF